MLKRTKWYGNPRSFKIRNRVYQVQKGDYILDNGSCLQFCAGDKRKLEYKHYISYTSNILPKTVIKEFNLKKMIEVKHHHWADCKVYLFKF